MVQEIQSTDEFYLDDYLPLDFAPNDAYDSCLLYTSDAADEL